MLGAERTKSNDSRRHRQSDRGEFNRDVDLLGALGELFFLSTAMAAESGGDAVDYMRGHMFKEAGGKGIKGPDLGFIDHASGTLNEIDVKTFDCAENKRYFAINDNKHAGLKGQCSAYFCLATPPRGRRMAVARLVPYSDVDSWKVALLGFPRGTPSRNFPIAGFLKTYFSSPPDRRALRGDVFPRDEIDAACADPAVRAALKAMIPTIKLA